MMSVDEQGFLWIADPWIAVIAIAVIVVLFAWCQLRLSREGSAQPAAVGVRANGAQLRSTLAASPRVTSTSTPAASSQE
jgi:hypothetical protein